jgi:CheY-like chemotaxis protein
MQVGKYILCVDNNADNRELIKFIFEQSGHNVLTCATAEACLDYARRYNISAFVLDYWLAGVEGSEICREIRTFNQKTPIIFFTGDARDTSRRKGISTGANAYLIKPNDLEKVVPTVNRFIMETDSESEVLALT